VLDGVQRGSGLTNLADRLAAAGGTLVIDAEPGRGTSVTGRLSAGLHAHPTGEDACSPPGGGGS
jgi:signal transduction histidine kinase